MPKRSRSGELSMPGRVVAPTIVNGRSGMRMVRAFNPLSITKVTEKSSIAGYKSSSTTRGSRWISSMNSTSRSPRLVRIPMRSPPRSRDGPAVVTMEAPISFAMIVASVVLPSPGGPDRSTWSSGSRRWRAASTETRRLSTAARCPTYSSRRWGRSWRSTCVSSGRATRLITSASSFMAFALPSGATIDLVEQLFGSAHSGPAAERGRDELGRLARSMTELLDHHLEDHRAQPFVVARRGDGRRALLLHVGSRLGERELGHFALELRHDVLGLLGPDAGQAAQVSFVLPRDGGRDVADGRRERAGRHQRPHVLHRDELLEELLVQLRREPN